MEHFPLNIIQDISNVIYPKLCVACHEALNKHEKVICLKCQIGLPKTDHVLYNDNPVAKKFWGKVPIERALAMYHFHKTSRLQEVMHALKYKGRKDVGIRLGNLMGYHLLQYHLFNDVDYITAVPLHADKLAKRGYNQSGLIAEGLSEVLNITFDENILHRTQFTDTQTKKSRLERWDNVKDIFEVTNPPIIEHKHILLLDDVITTGATLEACALRLIQFPGTKVSVVAAAHAEL
jgi:ComF family protein